MRFTAERDAPAELFADDLDAFDDIDDEDLPVIGPVQLPTEQERLDAVRAAPVMRLLAEGAGASSDLLQLALDAEVVHRENGELAAAADLDEVTTHENLVRVAIDAGISRTGPVPPPSDELESLVDDCGIGLLAELLDISPAGVPYAGLVEVMAELLDNNFPDLPDDVREHIPGWTQTQLERFDELGLITTVGEQCTLTAAGTPVAVALAEEVGIRVLLRPDPTTCDAAAIIDLLGAIDEQEWTADAQIWLAERPDRAAATDELIGEVCAADRDPVLVVAGLTVAAELCGADAVAAARRRLEGPHDGLILFWLTERSEIDPATVDPARLVMGMVSLLAVMLDVGGEDALVEMFRAAAPDQQLETLKNLWRLDHPRLPEVLEVIGDHHPDKVVRKAARKSAVQLRSRLAEAAGAS